MRLWILAAALALAACQASGVLDQREPFSEAALFADDAAYVAHRYEPARLTQDLPAELVAAGYLCAGRRGGLLCERNAPSRPGCAYQWTVAIDTPRVEAVRRERCEGLVTPP